MLHVPLFVTNIVCEDGLRAVDELAGLYHFDADREAHLAVYQYVEVGFVRVGILVEVAAVGVTVVGVVLTHAGVGVVVFVAAGQVFLLAAVVAREEQSLVVAHETADDAFALGPCLDITHMGAGDKATLVAHGTDEAAAVYGIVGWCLLSYGAFGKDGGDEAVALVGHEAAAVHLDDVVKVEAFDDRLRAQTVEEGLP